MKMNCWEIKNCGRQPGGPKVGELSTCAVATETEYDGKNGGKNAGRFCWKVAGTLCGGKVQGSFASKMVNCTKCEFFQQVKQEEGSNFAT